MRQNETGQLDLVLTTQFSLFLINSKDIEIEVLR